MTPTRDRVAPEERQSRFRWPQWLHPYLAAAILSPFLIFLADRNAFFTAVGTVDPWVYHGYFTHLREYISAWFPDTYYGSRLTWIIPGYVANALFSPVIANYVLHFAVYYLGALSLYYVVDQFYGGQAALLGSIAFTTYPYLWDAVGWDYVDGAGVGYYLCLIALIVRVRQRPHWIPSVLAGMVYGALLYTNLVWVVLTPLPFGIYLLTPVPSAKVGVSLKGVTAFLAGFAVGVVSLTLALCIINYSMGGAFWFYAPSINLALFHTNAVDVYKVWGYGWIAHAPWLIYPGMALLVSTVSCVRRIALRTGGALDAATLFHYQFIGAVLIMVACDSRGFYFLQYHWYTSYLIPFMFLALGCEFFRFKVLPRTIGLIAASAILFLPWSPAGPRIWAIMSGSAAVPVLMVSAAGAIVAVVWRGRVFAVVSASAALCLLNLYLLDNTGKFNYRAHAPDSRRQAFERMIEARNFIDQERGGRRAVFWFDHNDTHAGEFDSINSAYLYGYTQMGWQFPDLDEAARPRVAPSSMVVALSTRRDVENVLSEANRVLRAWGLYVALRASKDIGGQGIGYRVICLNLHRIRVGEVGTQAGLSAAANLALDKTASQSSTEIGALAANAVDGDTDGKFADGSVTHTKLEDHAGGRWIWAPQRRSIPSSYGIAPTV